MSSFCQSIRTNRIGCIGAGYVGGPTMAVIAEKCPDLEVYVTDINQMRIDAWNSEKLPIFEPGLDDVVKSCRNRNLFFTTAVGDVIDKCDIIFVSVNTPTKTSGLGAGKAADLCYWESCARQIAKHSHNNKIVVEKSTVPVRTAEALCRVLEANEAPGVQFCILSNPEFLAEGTALDDLYNPDRVLIGWPARREEGVFAKNTLFNVYNRWVAKEKILCTSLWSSELTKLVANAFLAQRISSINSIAMICELTGADIREVSRAIGMDSRIGPKFLQSSVGFGGSCFQKDILSLVYIAESLNLQEVANYWSGVISMNDLQKGTLAKKVITNMFNSVNSKKIAILGFAFKKNTGDTRMTPAGKVCDTLLADGSILHIFDPKVERENALWELRTQGVDFDENKFIFESSPLEAVRGAHAIVICTEWDCFKEYDYAEFFSVMTKPAFVFDGRNLLDHDMLYEIGFEVHGIGSPCLQRFKDNGGVTTGPLKGHHHCACGTAVPSENCSE